MALLNRHARIALGVAGTMALLATKDGATAADLSDRTPSPATGMHLGAVQLQSAGVMHFSRDGTLFVADPRGAAIYAIDVGDTYRDTSRTGVQITDVDGKIAAALGTTRDQIRIVDMVAHPTSQSLYFSLTRGKGNDAIPTLVRVTKADEKVTVLPLENIRNARADIPDAPTADAKTPWGDSKRTFSVTHLALVEGELYIAGLGNEEFASTLRRMPYPFVGKEASTTVEMYHTSHDRYETASPIESFVAIDLGGKPSLVAGYGCSPIVTLARDELAAGKHVRGKTVAELGGGNRPFDMIRYTNAKGKEYILVGNSNRTLTRLDPEQLANAKPMTSSVKQAWEPAGVGYLPVAIVGVLQLDNYNADNVVMLKRDIETGSLDVVSQSMRWL
ncbi:MAG TPA: hypothetical protein VFW03_24735 [Gemmatimonadaceae bacterium]|nr:hypothetical protein [Gemmatimonadaceae bacterium]